MELYLQMQTLQKTGEFEQGSMENLMNKTFWGNLSDEERDFLLEISIFSSFDIFQAAAFSGLPPEKTEKLLREKRFFIRYSRENKQFTIHSRLKKSSA